MLVTIQVLGFVLDPKILVSVWPVSAVRVGVSAELINALEILEDRMLSHSVMTPFESVENLKP